MRIYATPNDSGQYRVFGYGSPPRVWIATPAIRGDEIHEDTMMNIRDAHQNKETVRADQLSFDTILKPYQQ